jgi:hypothetical protein
MERTTVVSVVMQFVHGFAGCVCDAVIAPFAKVEPWVALSVFSLLLALLSVLAFRLCANQAALDRRKNKVVAHVLELRLYKDDLLSIFPIAARIAVAMPAYLASFAWPVVVLALPATLLLLHAACWFDHRPLRVGEPALVTARVAARGDLAFMSGSGSAGLAVDLPPVRLASRDEAVWRISPRSEGAHGFEAVAGNAVERKLVVAGSGLEKIQERRSSGGPWAALSHPLEPPIPAGLPIVELGVEYPRRAFAVGGFATTWLPACLVLTLALGWLAGRLCGVRF